MAIPVHGDVGDEKGILFLRLPVLDRTCETDQTDAVALARFDQVLGADVSGIDQMLGRGQALDRERGMDRLRALRRELCRPL